MQDTGLTACVKGLGVCALRTKEGGDGEKDEGRERQTDVLMSLHTH